MRVAYSTTFAMTRLAMLVVTMGVAYAIADLCARSWTEIQRAFHSSRTSASAW